MGECSAAPLQRTATDSATMQYLPGPGLQLAGGNVDAVISGKTEYGVGFRRVTIIPPTIDHLLCVPDGLCAIKVGRTNPYASLTEYLATYFHLLREDCFGPIRNGVLALRSKNVDDTQFSLQVYSDVKLIGVRCDNRGTVYLVSFCWPTRGQHGNSKQQPRQPLDSLKVGSLVCLSKDGYKTLFWATVARNPKITATGGSTLEVRCMSTDWNHERRLQNGVSYTMAESSSAFFEAYVHALKNLQRQEMAYLPFARHFVSLESNIAAPSYLGTRKKGGLYCLQSAFPGFLNQNCGSNDLQHWPGFEGTLDSSQRSALKHGLTKNLALIQGPPGTGKTFVGLLIARVLLGNLWPSRPELIPKRTAKYTVLSPTPTSLTDEPSTAMSDASGPLLIVCFTNHALDQFLEGIYKHEKNLVRVGSRSKSKVLKDCFLENLRWRAAKKYPREAICSDQDPALLLWSQELKSQIRETEALLRLPYINSRKCLELVAQTDQIENLLFCGGNRVDKVILMWLQGLPNPFGAYEWPENSSTHDVVLSADHLHQACTAEESLSAALMSQLNIQDEEEDIIPLSELKREAYPWTLGKTSRRELHQFWLETLKKVATQKLGELAAQYDHICHQTSNSYRKADLLILQQARVVGMTTSAAARNWELLADLKPEIVIVEEAAEVLEAHIIACLTPYTKHLILIGDHMQLRPTVSNHQLSSDYKLDVSMFERLVSGGVEHKTLCVQRRMRPSISKLLQSFYPRLTDHETVKLFENVRGLQKNVFLWDHTAEEESAGSTSKQNLEEARMAVELACYLTDHQGYRNSEVTILTLYSGQRDCINRLLGRRPTHGGDEEDENTMRVTSVDDFQGEESDIVILSLVRSNNVTVGFANNPNRVCVALSRARKGLYILGNGDLFRAKSCLWNSIIQNLASSDSVGTELPLTCPNHPGVSDRLARCAGDIRGSACRLPCGFVLPCSHICPRPCHYVGDHHVQTVGCKVICSAVHASCGHTCAQLCESHDGEEDACRCPPCEHQVAVEFRTCDHRIHLSCYQLSLTEPMITCSERCSSRLPCGHICPNRCGKPCATVCTEIVSFQLPCKHHQLLPCHQCSSPVLSTCTERCTKRLSCGHTVLVSCSQPIGSITCTEIIRQELSCGHSSDVPCHRGGFDRCTAMVPIKLSCGHTAQVACSQQQNSVKCTERVDVILPCNHTVSLPCHESSLGLPVKCSQPCSQKLSCGHRCKGICSFCRNGGHDAICCLQPCMKMLPCSHLCKARCSQQCRPCQVKQSCLHRCVHTRCNLTCDMPCISCSQPCPWSCVHHSCGLLCSEVCTRPRCSEVCPKSLACGHPCIGFCGEPCPTKCRVCNPSVLEVFSGQKIGKLLAETRFVQLVDCGHLCQAEQLDRYMDAAPYRQKCCPKCKIPISQRTLRYGSILKALHQQAQEKKKILKRAASAHPSARAQRTVVVESNGKKAVKETRRIWRRIHTTF